MTSKCAHIKKLAHGIYVVEMIGGFLLAVQASSVYIIVDHPREPRLAKCVICFTKALLVIYFLIIIIRILIFLIINEEIP